jgi:hypothetical protein
MKALTMQVTEKPRESQMSPLSLMFAAMVIVGTSALKMFVSITNDIFEWLRFQIGKPQADNISLRYQQGIR